MTSKMLSMTAFGQSTVDCQGFRIEVEVRSVNHRFLDVSVRAPRIYSAFEIEFKSVISSLIKRGKVDVSILRKPIGQVSSSNIKLDRGLYDQYYKLYKEIYLEHGAGVTPEVMSGVIPEILAKVGVIQSEDLEDGNLSSEKEKVFDAIVKALEIAQGMRLREGVIIEKELECRLNSIESGVKSINELADKVKSALAAKLTQRVQTLSSSIQLDPQRVTQEVAILADRCDVSEELSRLQSHIGAFRKRMQKPQSGKELDFLTQELNRELNTLSAKAQSAEISQLVVYSKGELEKIREQLQNVE